MFNPFKKKKQNQDYNNNNFNRDGNDYGSQYGNGFGNYGGDNSNNGSSGFGSNKFGSNKFSRFNRFGNRFGGNGGQKNQVMILTLIFIGVIVLAIWAKSAGKLGHFKNNWLNSPKEGVARMNAGLAQLQRTNRNLADEQLDKSGHHEYRNDAVNDPILLKNYFDNIPDMYSFGKVYSIFYFSNTDADNNWKQGIQNQRNKNDLKIMTFNGNNAQKNDGTFIYRYFYHNYTVPKNNKLYGKIDGVGHPFMALFINGIPQNIIVNYKDFENLMQKQYQAQQKADANANNYNLPDQHVGLPYPNYGQAIEQAKNYIASLKNGNSSNSTQSSSTLNSQDSSSSISVNQNDPKQN